VNLIESDILRIRAAEQRVLKESGLASLMETKKTFGAAGWLVCLNVFFQDAYKKKGKFEARLLSLFTFS